MINGPKQNFKKMRLFFWANRIEKEHEGYPGNRFFLLLFHSLKSMVVVFFQDIQGFCMQSYLRRCF